MLRTNRRVQRTVAIVKPHALHDVNKINAFIRQAGFYVVRSVDTVITTQQALELSAQFRSTSTFDDTSNGLCGKCVVMQLSKIDAVSEWLELMGPDDPEVARNMKPLTIRALFGNNAGENAVYGSADPETAKRDSEMFFPPPLKGTKEWLLDCLVPTITEAMSHLALQRPAKPYQWLADWIHTHRPLRERPMQYSEPVLAGYLLKSDRFEGIGKLGSSNIPDFPPNGLEIDGDIGYWNFRKCFGIAPVYGIGQSCKEGIEHCLRHISGIAGYDKIICLNMREEPVVFVGGLPVAPREHGALNDNVDHLGGIDGYELSLMEIRMKQDIFDRHSSQKAVEVYHQKRDMTNHARSHSIEAPNSIQTLSEVYAELREKGVKCEYFRIPIMDETAPHEKAFDALVTVMKSNLTTYPAFVMNCQMGRGRTTTAMVVMNLFWRIRGRAKLQHPVENINEGNRNLQKGEFLTVLKLLKLLPNGVVVKSQVDEAIDECGAFHNLRTSILDAKKLGEQKDEEKDKAEGRGSAFWLNRALNYLQRYYYVLLFGVYMHENLHAGFPISFRAFLRANWMLKGPVAHATLE